MVQFLLKLLLKQISCCAPRFPLVLTAKFNSLYFKELGFGVGNFGKLEVGVGIWKFCKVGVGSRIFYLRLRTPAIYINQVLLRKTGYTSQKNNEHVAIALQKRIMMRALKSAVHFDFRLQRIPRTVSPRAGTTQAASLRRSVGVG